MDAMTKIQINQSQKMTEEIEKDPTDESPAILKTAQVLKALELFHPPDKWFFLEEVRIGGGQGKDSEQRLDAYAINYMPSKSNKTVCYEIKVSRGDFKHEISKPRKRRAGLRLSNEFFFVTTKDLVTIEEVPVECGLMEVHDDGSIHTVIKAPFRNTIPLTNNFVASLCRRMDKNRLSVYHQLLEEDLELEVFSRLSLKVLKDHIDHWKNYKIGSKAVPDQIASAMEKLYYDIENAALEAKRLGY